MSNRTICSRCNGTGKELNHAELGRSLRMRRQKHGLLLKDVAEKMKVSQSYVSDLELGKRPWSTENIKSFQKALKK